MEEDYFKRFSETFARKCGSGRLRTSCTAANIRDVNDLVLSQEGAPQTHLTSRQIARNTGIHRSSVVRIIRDDLREIYVSSLWQSDARRNCPKQTVSTICYKINLSWYPGSSKLVSYTCEHWRLIAYYQYQKSVFVEVIWKYNRDLFFEPWCRRRLGITDFGWV